jgi:hypothetical protein
MQLAALQLHCGTPFQDRVINFLGGMIQRIAKRFSLILYQSALIRGDQKGIFCCIESPLSILEIVRSLAFLSLGILEFPRQFVSAIDCFFCRDIRYFDRLIGYSISTGLLVTQFLISAAL